jgi:3-hydroxybutyryl-CoA dehydrogenase
VTQLQTVAIIGAGPLGRKLAWLSSRAGFQTMLEDLLPSNLRKAAADLEALNAKQEDATLYGRPPGTLELATSLEGAVRHADLIIDCVPDELESKLEIFSLLDRMAPPRAIFGTPTLALSIGDLASCTYRASQCVAFSLNPRSFGEEGFPDTIEIVQTKATRPDVVETVRSFWTELGLSTTVRTDDWQETSLLPR